MDDPILERMRREKEEAKERRASKLIAQIDYQEKTETTEGKIVTIIQQNHDEFLRAQRQEEEMKAHQEQHNSILARKKLEEQQRMQTNLQAQTQNRMEVLKKQKQEVAKAKDLEHCNRVQKAEELKRNKERAAQIFTDSKISEEAAKLQLQHDKAAALQEVQDRREITQRLEATRLEQKRVSIARQKQTEILASKNSQLEIQAREEKRHSRINISLRDRFSMFETKEAPPQTS